MAKDVQFAFRIESTLRAQFVSACKEIDRPAGQVLREFMRDFVRSRIQRSLFDEVSNRPPPNMLHEVQESYEINR